MKTTLYCLSCLFKTLSTPPRPNHFPVPVTSNPHPHCSFCCPLFFGWMGYYATFDMLFYLIIIWIYICRALVPWYQKELYVCFMQQSAKFTEDWHIMWFFTGTLIRHHKTNTHTAHSGASRLTQPDKYIFAPPVICSQRLPLLHEINNSLISKIYFLQCLFFSKIIHL